MSKSANVFIFVLLSLVGGCRLINTNRLKSETVEPETWVHGYATNFDALGEPYGGCGVPQSALEWPHSAALNVQHTPRDYVSQLARPIQNDAINGAWDRGRNCGRYIRVELLDACIGKNADESNALEFCATGTVSPDAFSGASLDFMVADSCQDAQVWCRDDRYHVGLSTGSLTAFKKNGVVLTDLKQNWSTRKVRWRYIDAPNYTGDIQIGFLKDASPEWPAIVVTHLPRGIHGIEAEVKGEWVPATVIRDYGQAFMLPPTDSRRFKIRILDAFDEPLFGGRMYSFELPCKDLCSAPYTKVAYTVQNIGDTSNNLPQTNQAALVPVPRVESSLGSKIQSSSSKTESVTELPLGANATSAGSNWLAMKLQAELRSKKNSQDGYCVDLYMRNTSEKAIESWSLVLKAGGAKIEQAWNVEVVRNGSLYLVKPATSWARMIGPGEVREKMGFCASLPPGRLPATIVEIGP